MNSDDYDFEGTDNSLLNETDSKSNDDNEDNRCSEDEIIDKMIDIMTPEDYNEGKVITDYKKLTFIQISKASQRLVLDAQPSMTMTITELSGPSHGNYDQCLSIVSPEVEDQPVIKGQYCSMDTNFLVGLTKEDTGEGDNDGVNRVMNKSTFAKNVMTGILGAYIPITVARSQHSVNLDQLLEYLHYFIKKDMKFVSGFCLPTTCRPEDLSDAINEIMYPITRLPIKFHNDCEYIDKSIKLDNEQMIATFISLNYWNFFIPNALHMDTFMFIS
ncbi:unnamed protein product, partial [Medioppia subpectinata]